jgi:hypothetical protein
MFWGWNRVKNYHNSPYGGIKAKKSFYESRSGLVGLDAANKNLNYIYTIIKFYSTLHKIGDFDPPIRRVDNIALDRH